MWLAWAPRRLPGAGAPVAGPQRHGPRAVAGRQRHHRRLHRADAGRAVADRGAGRGPAADPRRRGVPARDRRAAGRDRAARCGTPTARPRPRSSPAPPGSTATAPVRIGLPLDGWDLAVVDAAGQPVPPGEAGELIIGGVGLARYLDPEKDAEKYAADADAGLGPRLPQRRPGARTTARAWSSSAAPTTRSSSAAAGSSSARSTAPCSPSPA